MRMVLVIALALAACGGVESAAEGEGGSGGVGGAGGEGGWRCASADECSGGCAECVDGVCVPACTSEECRYVSDPAPGDFMCCVETGGVQSCERWW